MKSLNRIAKFAVVVLVGIFFAKFIGYFFRIVVARADIELYGLYNLAFVVISFIGAFVVLGLDKGIVRYVSYYKGKKENQKADDVISTSLKVVFPLSIIFSLILFFFSDVVASFFHTENLSIILRFFAFLVPLRALSSIFGAILIAHKRITSATVITKIIEPPVRLAVVLVLFALGLRLFGLVAAFIVSHVVVLLLLFFCIQDHTSFRFRCFDKELIIFSLPLLSVLIIHVVMSGMDTLMLGYFTDVNEVGLYNAALPTASLLSILAIPLLSVFLPTITEKYAKKKSILREYATVTKWIFIFVLPFALIMIFFNKDVLLLLFGESYSAAGITLAIICVFYLFKHLSEPSKSILIMLKKTKLILYYVLAALIVNIVLNLVLIPLAHELYNHGMYGAALATGISFLLISFFDIIFASKYTNTRIFNKGYLKILAIALASVVFVYAIRMIVPLHSIWQLGILFVFFLVIYVGLLFLFSALDNQDISVLKAMKNKVKSKIPYLGED